MISCIRKGPFNQIRLASGVALDWDRGVAGSLCVFTGSTQETFIHDWNFINTNQQTWSAVAQWKSAWLETEGPRVQASPASLGCVLFAGPCSAVGNVSGYRCVSDCRSRGRDRSRPGPIFSWRLIMKLFLRSFSSLLLIHSRRVVVSYKRKYVHELLVNRLFKPAQEKVWLGELTVPQWP